MTLHESELSDLAERLLADYDAVCPGDVFANGLRLDLDDAWHLQAAVTRLREARGELVAGYKIDAVTPGNQQMLGLTQPVWGRLWQSEFYDSGVRLDRAAYAELSLEAEFGIELSQSVKPGMSMQQLAACVGSVYPTLELHNLRLCSAQPHGPELIANNCINCGDVKGAAVTAIEKPCETSLQLVYDGKLVDSWEKLKWPHDILKALGWLAQSLESQGLHLKRGDFVLTSAWGPPIPVQNHHRVEVTSSAFGDAFAVIT